MPPETDQFVRLYAHSKPDAPEADWQLLTDHLQNVAALAASFADGWKARPWAEAAGLLHDFGKASKEYQEKRLRGAGVRVDHSTAGAQRAAESFGSAGRILAACIAGHHSGLPDGKSKEDSCLAVRLKKPLPDVSSGRELPIPAPLPLRLPLATTKSDHGAFQVSFFTRMIYSCLVDADFLDTEQFMDPDRASWREGFPKLEALPGRLRPGLDRLMARPGNPDIKRLRREILEACLANAENPPGLFSLTVPTGGGKTLSSLAFALNHALRHGLDRIVYVIPFTSIIEQNAEVFREYLGADAVLEHHSAFDSGRVASGGSESNEDFRRFELATENWDAPLVVTTAVQFFESLYGSRSSRCRKLHNIARSVVILDEAQMLPVPFLMPCIEALRELARNYGTTVVLCTATQPAITKREEEFKRGLEDVREIVPDPLALYESFRRVTVEDLGSISLDEVGDIMRRYPRVLCVVNTRPEAREVFERIRGKEGAYHLSALMCAEHRSLKLREIRKLLAEGLPCRLVSTRLIEAGVDVDFPVVLRALAGIDSIAQAAGRCNREGKIKEGGRLLVFELEGRLPPGSFRAPAETAREIMRRHSDPLSPAAIEDYFRQLYWRAEAKSGRGGLDREHILDALGSSARELFFPFREVAEKFRLIKEEGEALLIPFDDRARGLIAGLRRTEFPGGVLRRLQRYTVQVPGYMMKELKQAGVVEMIQGVYPVLVEEMVEQYYREDTGLVLPEVTAMGFESMIV